MGPSAFLQLCGGDELLRNLSMLHFLAEKIAEQNRV